MPKDTHNRWRPPLQKIFCHSRNRKRPRGGRHEDFAFSFAGGALELVAQGGLPCQYIFTNESVNYQCLLIMGVDNQCFINKGSLNRFSHTENFVSKSNHFCILTEMKYTRSGVFGGNKAFLGRNNPFGVYRGPYLP